MQTTTKKQITEWLSNLKIAIQTGRAKSPQFLKPYHLLTLAIEAKRFQKSRLALPDQLRDYALRMGLWEAAGISPPHDYPRFQHPPEGRFLPVQSLNSSRAVEMVANDLAGIGNSQNDSKALSELKALLLEILNNYYDHAQDQLCGLACAQPWPKGNLAQIALADAGIGIRATLGQNDELTDRLRHENACFLATEYSVTSKPKGGHSGYGLTLARDIIRNVGGTFILLSRKEGFIEKNGSGAVFSTPSELWQGTLLILEWEINKPLNSLQVYNSWPPSDLEA